MCVNFLKKCFNKIYEFYDEKENSTFIDFLTGFRGTLAISVICSHGVNFFTNPSPPSNSFPQAKLFKQIFSPTSSSANDILLFKGMGHWYGVYGFFFLSSFLLTYRLYIDFTKTDHSKLQIALAIVKYFIRRFFRIYLPYVAYCSMIKYYPKFGNAHNNHPSWHYASWDLLVSLHHPGGNHLWTIAPEIKYYFFPPWFALFIYKSKKLSWLTLVGSTCLAYYYDTYHFSFDERYFTSYFPIFFKGSLVGIYYFKLENLQLFVKCKKLLKLNYFAGFAIAYFYIPLLRNSSELLPLPKKYVVQNADDVKFYSYYWSLFLLCMILFAPNRFTNVFNTRLLQKFCQFSYGIYLMHPYGLALTFDYLPKANSGFEQIALCLFFSYCFGKCFYYVIEYPLVKMAKFLCNQISQAANKLCSKFPKDFREHQFNPRIEKRRLLRVFSRFLQRKFRLKSRFKG